MVDGTLRQSHPKSWVNGAPQYVSRGFPLYNLEARKLFPLTFESYDALVRNVC
jgi:hypothetical protein